MLNSARCVLPAASINKSRKMRSTAHGGATVSFRICWKAISHFIHLVISALRRRAAPGWWDQTKSPLNKYDSAGWLCQYPIRLRNKLGLRSNGESAGHAPPTRM